MRKGNLYIISAPSGAGKSSLISALLTEKGDEVPMMVSISHTTRVPRPGETDGVHYYFVDVPTFEQMIAEDAFLEYANVFGGNYYGTSLAAIEENLAKGVDVFLDIDWQGARQIREKVPNAKSIFILPPSVVELENRLNARGQDSAEVIASRMAKACDEMSHFAEYDYVVINDDFSQALENIATILQAERLKTACQKQQNAELFADLLAKQ